MSARSPTGVESKVRIEEDALGKVEVPADHLWGAQTERSHRISGSESSATAGAGRSSARWAC